jgi:hypothetical protein
MVEAFTRSNTSPQPGCGTGTVRISTAELPGRYAADMADGIISCSPGLADNYQLSAISSVLRVPVLVSDH